MFPNLQESLQETYIPMSYDEFLCQIDEDAHAEWVDGVAIVFSPPTLRHQNIVGFLLCLIYGFVNHFNLGIVLASPIEMKTSPDANAREPDLLFIAKGNLDRLSDKKLEGPADLVVEIISPESARRDRTDKFYEYQQAGIREYWLIDPRVGFERADFWVLDEDGRYQPIPLGGGGIYRSAVVPNFWLRTSWLWSDSNPSPIRALATIIGRENLIAALHKMDEDES